MYLTGGQPARGSELGVVKFQNTNLTLRNFYVLNGEGFYSTEYHKARASTNYSFYIVRYLPDRLTELVLLYIAYIRPFARMLYSHGKKNVPDLGYLFCSNSSPDKPWNGELLSEILQAESEARLNARLNLWSARRILIAITKVHVKEITGHFAKDNRAWRDVLMNNPDFNIFAWQAGHQQSTNVAIYGLDAAFPGRLQPELMEQYRRISRLWHRWLGILGDDGKAEIEQIMTPRKKRK